MKWSDALADSVSIETIFETIERTNDTIVCVVGPTASGKSALAAVLSRKYNGEIVSADSVQVYRGFDIGSAKPTAQERRELPHHVIDIADPMDHVDARSYVDHADRAIADCIARGKRPIVCGGTFLWVKALLFGLAKAPPGDSELRELYRQTFEKEGAEALHAQLRAVDPESAARLHPNDFVRVSRALEVEAQSGRPLSSFQAEHKFQTPRYAAQLIGVAHTPDELTVRIRARVEAWMQNDAFIEEVRSLIDRGYGDARAMGSVGYKEAALYLKGELPREKVVEEMVRATRIFARRQRTWLNSEEVLWCHTP